MKALWLALEGGGSTTRILLTDAGGVVHARVRGGPASPLYIDRPVYARELRGLLRELRRQARRLNREVTAAGLAGPMDRELVGDLVRATFDGVRLVRASEAGLALACYDLSWGLSVVSGTGASARFVGKRGRYLSCGGFGPQFGDEGSAAWIGREAITAVMRARDGRDPHTALDGHVCHHLELEDIGDIYSLADRSGHIPAPRVASLACSVCLSAAEGDACARSILARAGRALARLACETLKLAKPARGPVPVVPTGGVFLADPWVLRPFRAALRKAPVSCIVHEPVHEPVAALYKIIATELRKERQRVS